MCLRDVVIFLAGAEFFHTIGHIVMPYFINFPIEMSFVVFTATMNNYAIIGNAVVTVLLLWWAKRLSCKECKDHKH